MNINVNSLCFDPDDILDSGPTVGAYLLDGYGNQISSTDGSLNVNVTNPIEFSPSYLNEDGYLIVDIADVSLSVDISYEYAEGSNFSAGDIGAFVLGVDENGDYRPFRFEGDELLVKSSYDSSLLNEDGYLYVDFASSLLNADGYLNVNLAAPIEFNVDNNFEWDFDAAFTGGVTSLAGVVRDDVLSAGAGVSADGDVTVLRVDNYGALWTNPSSNVGILTTLASVGTSAATLLSSEFAGRRKIIIQNTCGNAPIYIGSAGVTAADGLKIPKGDSVELEIGPDVSLYVIAPQSTNVRVLELA